jgi:hypothetical protein
MRRRSLVPFLDVEQVERDQQRLELPGLVECSQPLEERRLVRLGRLPKSLSR